MIIFDKFETQVKKLGVDKVLITPEIATYILENMNGNNRPLNRAQAESYSKSMLDGTWREDNPDNSISISSKGNLLNGQHRLEGVVKADKPVWFFLHQNLPESMIEVQDTGKARNGTDVLAIGTNLSSEESKIASICLQGLYQYENNRSITNVSDKSYKLTNPQLIKYFYDKEEELRDAITFFSENLDHPAPLLRKGYIVFLYIVLSRIDKYKAKDYLTKVFKGINLQQNTTELAVRELLTMNKSAPHTRKYQTHILLYSVMKGWNSLRSGRNIKSYKSIIFRVTDTVRRLEAK